MNNTKEIIRVLGFIQEYFDNHADKQEPDCRKELFRDWSEITMDAIALLKTLSAFKAYFDDLYGKGLEVANWHMNGTTEPFDSFYDSAMEAMEEIRNA